jgi:hypothetical protein
MAATRRVIEISIGEEDLAQLEAIGRSRTAPASWLERARILLAYRSDPSTKRIQNRRRLRLSPLMCRRPRLDCIVPFPGGEAGERRSLHFAHGLLLARTATLIRDV